MIEKDYLQQLEKFYPQYLRDLVSGIPFGPLRLRGGKAKPVSTLELYSNIDSFLKYEKKEEKQGWVIEWALWQSKTFGHQRWPSSISVNTEEDFLFLTGKQKEAQLFKVLIQELLLWNAGIKDWLETRPLKVLEYSTIWKDLCAVVDYLLHNDVRQYYIRSLPVPVHTKFIQQYQAIILSILKHLQPERFPENAKSLEVALGLQVKPSFFLLRWLDPALAGQYTSGIEVLSVPIKDLQNSAWEVGEVWVVENETNLYLLPKRRDALVVFSKGYALHDLTNIPLFQRARVFYWGDLDEDGYIMLHQFRGHYPHVQSVFMDEETAVLHHEEMIQHPFRLKQDQLQLTTNESKAYALLMQQDGRIEQERLKQDYLQARLQEVQKKDFVICQQDFSDPL